MTKFINIVKSFTADETGAVASEYAVLLVLIAAAIIVAVFALSGEISDALIRVGCIIGAADEAAALAC